MLGVVEDSFGVGSVCVAVCCSVLQCVAVCCSVLQCVAVVLQSVAVRVGLCQCQYMFCVRLCLSSSVLQRVAVRCNVLQCVAVCCSVLQCVAACCRSCCVLRCEFIGVRVTRA